MANRGAAEAVVLWLLRQGATETAGSPQCLPKLFKSDFCVPKQNTRLFSNTDWGGVHLALASPHGVTEQCNCHPHDNGAVIRVAHVIAIRVAM